MNNRFQSIDAGGFDRLLSKGTVLEQDQFGPKVVALDGDRIGKLFRRKRFVSSALWYSYAARFVANSERLRNLGYAAPRVIATFVCRAKRRHLVIYEKLAGSTLRQSLADPRTIPNQLLDKLATLMSELHDDGIYFRSLHLGNILLSPTGQLGLIDVADTRFRSRPLSLRERRRNFRPLLQNAVDRSLLGKPGIRYLIREYGARSRLKQENWLASFPGHVGLGKPD